MSIVPNPVDERTEVDMAESGVEITSDYMSCSVQLGQLPILGVTSHRQIGRQRRAEMEVGHAKRTLGGLDYCTQDSNDGVCGRRGVICLL